MRGTRQVKALVRVAVTLALVGIGLTVVPRPTPVRAAASCASRCYSFAASGLDGGSYIASIAVDPSGSGVVLAGSDVGGVYRSTDLGQTWSPANAGITVGALSVGSLAFSPTVAGEAYVALGHQGPGGVEVSTDDGRTWSLRSTVPQFNTPNASTGARPSGRTLAVNPAGVLFAATSSSTQGVMRSTDDGRTWTTIGMGYPSGAVLRGILADPNHPNVVYVANYGIGNLSYPSGLYVSTNATSARPTFSPVLGAPLDVEDLAMVGSTLYAAAGASGVYALPDLGHTWTAVIPGTGPLWASVAGYPAAGGPVLYAGAARPARNLTGGGYDSVVKSTDGGAHWASMTGSPASVLTTEGGPTGPQWWLAATAPAQLLGGAVFIPRELALDPANPAQVFVSGDADIWSSADAGATWYPMVRGLGTTEERGVATDPNRSGTSYAVGYDWGLIGSADGMQHVADVSPPGVSAAFDVALDTTSTPSTVYLAGFDETRPTTTADVYVDADPLSGKPWSSTGLAAATGGSTVFGVSATTAVLPGTSAPQPVVLAAVGVGPGQICLLSCGIWRKVGAGPWHRVSTAAMYLQEGSLHASFAWPAGSAIAYLYDPATGLWRSSDYGASWVHIWTAASNHDLTGFAATAPGDPGTVFVSLGTAGVWKLTGAATGAAVGSGITAAEVGTFTGAGPLTTAPDGAVWVAQVAPYGYGLWRSANGGATWTSVGDATYQGMADFPSGVSVAPDGGVLVATRGDGVVVG